MVQPVLRLVLAALLAFEVAGCGGRTESYRYKLTLAVNTSDGVRRASSVVEVRYRDVTIPARGTMHRLQGEALYLDLGPDARPLIALLTTRYRPNVRKERGWSGDAGPGALLWQVYGVTPSRDFMDDVPHIAAMRGPRAITPAELPDLVTFADVNDPNSVIEIDPKDLPATLGPGITWSEITLEITDEPITTGIRTKLPWVADYFERNLQLDGAQMKSKRELANILSWSDFDLSRTPRKSR